jgi:hypothetical protein
MTAVGAVEGIVTYGIGLWLGVGSRLRILKTRYIELWHSSLAFGNERLKKP